MVEFTVTGKGPFPFGMLCKDEAWPATPLEGGKMGAMYQRTVTLVSHHEPNTPLWHGAGWAVEITRQLVA